MIYGWYRLSIKSFQTFYKCISKMLCANFVVGCLLLCCAGCAPFAINQSTSSSGLVQQAPKVDLTYVAIGASDTFGVGADDPPTQNWPYTLSHLLGKKNVRVINLGVPDIHVHNALSAELPVALDTHPDLVTVWLAVNDLADKVPLSSYSHDLDLLLTRLRAAAPHARIAVANVPDITLLPHFQSYDKQALRTQILAYNDAIASIVRAHHVLLVDLYRSELAQHPEYISSDGFHPNTIGYTRIAEIFYEVLKTNAP
jgi:lysophospholipase L1-like esterase